jgi:selenocysteine lyase/cysteine desulfurase
VRIFANEAGRVAAFPVAGRQIFLAHAGVTALPRCAAEAISAYARQSSEQQQEFADVFRILAGAREAGASLLGVGADEIALLGPTALGLSLFANGLEWSEGDEIVCYGDDYPSNVYPWTALERLGVSIRFVQVERTGHVSVDAVRAALGPRTRMAALSSCHYLTGWRLDIPAIAQLLRERGILFSLDAIQTVGAFPTDGSCVDFLSADSHKWMLGPMAAGLVFVARRNFERCRPTLLGAWNVRSPEFLASETIAFEPTARRYEPGVLNVAGIVGMKASLEMIKAHGSDAIARAILEVRDHLEDRLAALGMDFLSPRSREPLRSGILTAKHPSCDSREVFAALEREHIIASLRCSRDGRAWLRFSPHFYNTAAEMDRVAEVMGSVLKG